jgi:hypothetical protein
MILEGWRYISRQHILQSMMDLDKNGIGITKVVLHGFLAKC